MESHGHESDPMPDDAIVSDFADFHALTYIRTFRMARRAAGGDEHVASDAVQDAFAVMLANWITRCGRSQEDNRAYLMRIAFNRVMDHYRQQGRFTELDEARMPHVDDPALDAVPDQPTLLDAVVKFLDRQPPRRRAVAVLRFIGGYEYAEIAEILDISESTARTHVERVRVLIKPYVDHFIEINQGGERS